MKEKVKRILDLIRAGKLTLDDAAPLLTALSSRLALIGSDQDLIRTLLDRDDLDTDQIAEHLLLLRGLKGPGNPGFPPPPPPPPRRPQVVIGGRRMDFGHGPGLDDLGERIAAKLEQAAEKFAAKAERLGQNVEDHMNQFAHDMERTMDSWDPAGPPPPTAGRSRVLRIQVESEDGDSYNANLPLSLAPHLEKLIPAHGIRALEKAGFSLEALQLLIESGAPSGELISAEDSDGNSIKIILR